MRTLSEQLTKYAAYHRDRRNIATHFVGIPMIVVAATTLLARPMGVPALVVATLACAFYFLLDFRYGVAMTVFNGLALWAGVRLGALPTAHWLVAGVGLFVVGWAIQFVGHWFEGRKPAFVDDLVGLLVGPLFIVAEAGFALGLRDGLRREIEAQVGPTHGRVSAAASESRPRAA